jgi:hypothetical protein
LFGKINCRENFVLVFNEPLNLNCALKNNTLLPYEIRRERIEGGGVREGDVDGGKGGVVPVLAPGDEELAPKEGCQEVRVHRQRRNLRQI